MWSIHGDAWREKALGCARVLGLTLAFVLMVAGLGGCDPGACGYCNQADDDCVVLCDWICETCDSVDPELVEDVRCVNDRIHVHTSDGAIHVCERAAE